MGRYVFKLPDIGEGAAEAEITSWRVQVGQDVAEDQPLVDVMTEKATVELTAPVSGRVVELNGVPGDMAAVGSAIVVLEVEGAGNAAAEATPSAAPASPAKPAPDAPAAPPEAKSEPAQAAPVASGGGAGGQGRYVFRLPDIGEGAAEAEITTWRVKVGDHVAEDQPLVDVMTEKATVELTAPISGVVLELNGEPGQMAAVGSGIVVLQVEGAGNVSASAPAPAPSKPVGGSPSSTSAAPSTKAAPAAAPAARSAQASTAASAPSGRAPGGGGGLAPAFTTRPPGAKPLASPAVRRRAHELGIELQFVPGAGPGGRISHADLDAFVAAGGRSGGHGGGAPSTLYAEREGTEEVRVIGLRRKIAEKMAESKRRIPHFGYVEEVDVTELEELRVHLNATKRPDQPKLTLLPFIMRALVRVLPQYPQINARYDDEANVVTRYEAAHIGMATQTPSGLIVPVIRHAEARDVWGLAAEISRIAKATREGTATREELSGSTITVTSLGPLGGVSHFPVINHPEVGIIGPNKIIEKPVVRDGQIVVRKMMNISSSFDHRVVDGWDAADFIQKLKLMLEHPATVFMD